ncbi:MAG: alkylation response protein AidB-like acyl-CoA dehydrogenase [Bermanella sp.]|jgi:alkylation response protein AidB-like acyl-CoA dehydrogenase
MDFSYSEEQQDIRNLAQQILGDQCAPERLKKLESESQYFDRELWQALCEAGLTGIALAEQFGGMGYNFESLCILLEEAGRNVAKLPLLPVLVGAALPIQAYASEAQKQALLPDIIAGKSLVTWARIEPNNENVHAPALAARSVQGGFELSGRKHCVAVAADASHIVLAARDEGGELLVVLLDPKQGGVKINPQIVTSGETVYELTLDAASIDEGSVLAKGQAAKDWLVFAEQHYQGALCAMAVGLCDKMMRMTASYTTEREQFGRAVATFQAVGHRMADCFKDVECLRLTSQQAIFQLTAGSASAEEAITVAKIWCGDVCHRVSQAAQHCHGGIGVDRDYPLFRYCLVAREIELSAGSSAALLQNLGDYIADAAKSAAA